MDESSYRNLRERYVAFFGEEPTPVGSIIALESSLDIVLPRDLKQIAEFYSGGMLGGISHNALATRTAATNIAEETLSFRAAVKLPHRFIVLAEPAESLVVLDTDSEVVTWCDNYDVSRLEDSSQMVGKPTTWSSYASFFEYLLDEEGEERAEQGN